MHALTGRRSGHIDSGNEGSEFEGRYWVGSDAQDLEGSESNASSCPLPHCFLAVSP